MNKQARINQALRLLDKSFNIKQNVVKINVGNTLEHELAKCKKAYELIKNGKQIITEAIFSSGGRADIFCLNDFRVYEILHTETMEEALAKKDYYPESCDIVYLTTEEVLKDE